MSNKYNFNPTPEQLADPKFWASDEVPEGAEYFHPQCSEYVAHYTKIQNARFLTFNRFQNCWYQDPIASYAEKKSIERPADPVELKRCPCGEVPTDIYWREDYENKSYSALPNCCYKWNFSFETDAGEPDSVVDADALKGWDALPRGFE